MPADRSPRHVRVFLASPGDVREEREEARKLLQRLEREPLVRRDFTIEVVSWDDPDAPAPMLATLTPQQAVVHALPRPSECDVTVVILWGRMGTPLDELKPDGTPYSSGTEWEFEDAWREKKPVLLYRKTAPLPAVGEDAEEILRQRTEVEHFFEQFEGPGGVLKGGFVTYETVEEFRTRLKTDIESLLSKLKEASDSLPPDASRLQRARAAVCRWSIARLLLVTCLGLVVTLVAATAVGTFEATAQGREVPILAHVLRYVLLLVAVSVPLALLVLAWWRFGSERHGERLES